MSPLGRAVRKARRDGVGSLVRRIPSYLLRDVVLKRAGVYLYRAPTLLANATVNLGTNVYECEWDVLIVLDTCRVDALQAVANEYEFLTDVGSIWSVGSASAEWTSATFVEEYADEIAQTAYLTANGYAKTILEDRSHEDADNLTFTLLDRFETLSVTDFGRVEYLFTFEQRGESGPLGHEAGVTPPRYVTERAITVGREANYDRTILHYMQPHYPYVSRAMDAQRDLKRHERGGRSGGWIGHVRDTGDTKKVWEAYLADLRYVLDDISIRRAAGLAGVSRWRMADVLRGHGVELRLGPESIDEARAEAEGRLGEYLAND